MCECVCVCVCVFIQRFTSFVSVCVHVCVLMCETHYGDIGSLGDPLVDGVCVGVHVCNTLQRYWVIRRSTCRRVSVVCSVCVVCSV